MGFLYMPAMYEREWIESVNPPPAPLANKSFSSEKYAFGFGCVAIVSEERRVNEIGDPEQKSL